jgi:hypothetical protein
MFPSPYDPRPVPRSRFAVLHSCGALCQTCVPAYVHSLLHSNMITPLFPCTFSTPILMLHASPSLYVTLMLTFPVTLRLALIVLQVPIWLVVVFKSLVFTHVPQFKYCLLPALSYLLNSPCLSSSLSPTRLSSLSSLKSKNMLVQVAQPS